VLYNSLITSIALILVIFRVVVRYTYSLTTKLFTL